MPEHVPGRKGARKRGRALRMEDGKRKTSRYLVITVEREIRKSWLACVSLERVTFGKFLQPPTRRELHFQ